MLKSLVIKIVKKRLVSKFNEMLDAKKESIAQARAAAAVWQARAKAVLDIVEKA